MDKCPLCKYTLSEMADETDSTQEAGVAVAEPDDVSADVTPDPIPDTASPEGLAESDDAAPEPSTDEPVSMEQALEESLATVAPDDEDATAETPSEESNDASQPPADQQPESESGDQGQAQDDSQPGPSMQSTLDRIRMLDERGRLDELTPTERGVYDRIVDQTRGQLQTEMRQDTEFGQLYVKLMEAESEGNFMEVAREVAGGRGQSASNVVAFFDAYKNQHPEVTLDNPNPNQRDTRPDVRRLRDEGAASARTETEGVLKEVAKGLGISDTKFLELQAKSQGVNTLMAEVIAEGITAGIEAKLPEVTDAERKAATKEASLTNLGAVKTPRSLTGGATDPSKSGKSDGPVTMGDALQEAIAAEEKAS